jgi:predicted ATP-grasp superfamily ATP-dependent carboligase
MANIFVFEFVCGGGFYSLDNSPQPRGSWLTEGQAMLAALTADLAANGVHTVSALRDSRIPEINVCQAAVEYTAITSQPALGFEFDRLAKTADWTIVIAPETDWLLSHWVERARRAGGRPLNCSPATISVTTSKANTSMALSRKGIATPQGLSIDSLDDVFDEFPFPAVLKPEQGAGSQGMKLLNSRGELEGWTAERPMRLEEWVPGLDASVSFLCGPHQTIALPAMEQILSDNGAFVYMGGEGPLVPHLAERAQQLAKRAIDAIGGMLGWVGVDLILGAAADGSGDYVIEVNPRLTTSYVGLRRAIPTNLASAMIELAEGHSITLPAPRNRVRFSANGGVEKL